jgi:Reverse transcriptase (RNA-dependent DNA polymerase)
MRKIVYNGRLGQNRLVEFDTMPDYSTIRYLLEDQPKTLFPLSTTLVLVEHHAKALLEYIYEKVLHSSHKDHSFLTQVRCHASKYGFHLRRTVKLDPVAELFIYDLIYRNRQSFRRDFRPNRKSFGYQFVGGQPISLTKSYGEFRAAISSAQKQYKYSAKFDISVYFNSLYHHDLVAWFSENGRSGDDTEHFGQFLREANAGRSIDCLPHGIHPCKVIGAEFLKFIDNSINVRCQLMLRFMDDFYLFDDDENILTSDFLTIQRILGEKGLSLNAAKTKLGHVDEIDIGKQVDAIKAGLLKFRRKIIEVSGDPIEIEVENGAQKYEKLTPTQVEYLFSLLKDPDIVEADAELVLVLLRDHGEDVLKRMQIFFERFPSLSKNVYTFCQYVQDKSELSGTRETILGKRFACYGESTLLDCENR